MVIINLKKLICLCCEKPIKTLQHGFLDGASVGKIEGGYGSIHDDGLFEIVVCDDCMTEKEQKGIAHYTDLLFIGVDAKKE